jgi:RNA recognition motif-containing protein
MNMSTKLFIGNLDYSTMEQQLRTAFEPFGQVVSATVILDRMTGQSRGFGFVEFQSADEAQNAISTLDGTAINGRNINVNVARERTNDRSSGGGGGRGGFGGGRSQNSGDRW